MLIVFINMYNGENVILATVVEKEIIPIQVLAGKWGSKPDEFGLVVEGEVKPDMPFGPPHFAVDDKSNVYVADKYNSRVQVYNQNGELLRVLSVEDRQLLNRISVDTWGSIYLVDYVGPVKIAVYDKALNLRETTTLSDMINDTLIQSFVGYGFTVDPYGHPVIVDNHTCPGAKKILIYLNETKAGMQPYKYPQLLSHSLDEYSTMRVKRGNILEIQIKADNMTLDTIEIKENQEIWSAWEMGKDQIGNIYYATETDKGIFVYFINITSRIINKIPLITNLWHGAYRCPVLGLDGNIYYMGSSKDKFWIDKYPLNN